MDNQKYLELLERQVEAAEFANLLEAVKMDRQHVEDNEYSFFNEAQGKFIYDQIKEYINKMQARTMNSINSENYTQEDGLNINLR